MCSGHRGFLGIGVGTICIIAIVCVRPCFGITLSELRKVVADSNDASRTARLLYIEENTSNDPVKQKEDSIEYKVKDLNRHTIVEVNAVFDRPTARVIALTSDLRDLDAFLKANNLPREQRVNLSRRQVVVCRGGYQLALCGQDAAESGGTLLFSKHPDNTKWQFWSVPELGSLDDRVISDEHNPRLSEVTIEGRQMLRVYVRTGNLDGTFECDPTIGYRYRRIEWRYEGQIFIECVADDYRDVNGVYYPFHFVDRRFYPGGGVQSEKTYTIEEAAFGIKVIDDDFRIFVPGGTTFLETVMNNREQRLGMDRYIGIDDAIALARQITRNH